MAFYATERESLGNSVGKTGVEPASMSVAGAGCAQSRAKITAGDQSSLVVAWLVPEQ